MMDTNKTVTIENRPRVRFKGFSEDWRTKTLSELGGIQTGSTPSTAEDSNYSKLGLLWVTPTDINSQLILNSEKRLSAIGRKKARIVPANTILVTCIASIGKNGLLQDEASFNQQINSLTPYTENDPYFLLSQSYFWSENMKKIAAKGTMQIFNKTQFSCIQTFTPELTEQTQIGNFFQKLDQSIALHEKKLNQTQNLKKAMLEKMFPKAGCVQPEIRLKGFSGDWILDQLKNRIVSFDFQRIPLSEEQRVTRNGKYPYYGASGIIDFIDDYIFDGEYVLLGEDGANILTRSSRLAFIVQGKFWLNNHAHIFQAKGSNLFLAEALERINFEKYNTGTAQPKLNMEVCNNLELYFPEKDEQIAIGQFFKQLDETLVLQQQQLQTLKNLKQAFLEKMFV